MSLKEKKELLEEVISRLKINDKEWFTNQGIIVKEKDDYLVLNYNQFAPKTLYNVLTRGLVIHKTLGIVSCPFFRFFNYGEPTAAIIDFGNAEVIEKLDGSLVGVAFPEKNVKNPIWHFRSLLSTHQKDRDFAIKGFVLNEELPLLMKVEPYLKEIKFTEDLVEYSLMFEFISDVNTIITKYEEHQYGLYLIGARHLPTLQEMSEDELDTLARRLGLQRPRRWKTSSYDEIVTMMSDFPKDYEGFVVRDRVTGARNKIKSADYLKRHRLLTKLNYKNLIPLYFDGERSEIEAYFSQTKTIFDEIEKAYEDFVKQTLRVLVYWQEKNVSRKEVALGIIGKEPRNVCSVVFKLLETAKTEQETAIRDFVRKMQVPTLVEAWNLKDTEEIVEELID